MGEVERAREAAPKLPKESSEQKKTEKEPKLDPASKKTTKKKANEKEKQTAEFFVRELTRPIHNTNRSVTCDNWFSSIPVFDKMRVDFGIFMTGSK